MMLTSVIVHDFDINDILAKKTKADTPLIVDSNAPLPATLSDQGFETIAGWDSQLVNEIYSIQHRELSQGHSLNGPELVNSLSFEKCLCIAAAKRFDCHGAILSYNDTSVLSTREVKGVQNGSNIHV
jgi:hypothetical protein